MSEKVKAVVNLSKAIVRCLDRPIKLTIGLTYMCQSRCSYCDVWKRYHKDPQGSEKEVSSSLHLKMLESLKDSLMWVEFTGGEPFLRKDIAEIVTFAMNKTCIVAAGVTSNGLAREAVLTNLRRILKDSKKKQMVVGISIDGDPETYSRARGVDGFRDAVETFLELKRLACSFRNLRPHIAYTINRFNAGSFLSSYRFLHEKYGVEIPEMSFSIEHPFGYYFEKGRKEGDLSIAEFSQRTVKDVGCILGLRQQSKPHNVNPLSLFYDYYLRNIPKYLHDSCRQVIPCKACQLSAYIDPYGLVYPCTMWNRVLGNLNNESFGTVWASKERFEAMHAIKRRECPSCWTPCEAQPSWLANWAFLKREKQ